MSISSSLFTTFGEQFHTARDIDNIKQEQDVNGTLLSKEERELIEHVTEETELSFLGVGGTRISFELPNSEWVVLFPRWGPDEDSFHNGRVSNNNEVKIWTNLKNAGKEDRYNLLPILDSHDEGFWVIKPKITPVTDDIKSVQEEWSNGGKEKLWDNIFAFNEYINMMDITQANACKWRGKFVLFDYGSEPKK